MRTALLGFAVLIGTVVTYAPTSSTRSAFFNDRYCTIGGRGSSGSPDCSYRTWEQCRASERPWQICSRMRSGSRARQAHGFSGGSEFDGIAAEKPGNSSRLEESSGAHRAATTPGMVASRQRSAQRQAQSGAPQRDSPEGRLCPAPVGALTSVCLSPRPIRVRAGLALRHVPDQSVPEPVHAAPSAGAAATTIGAINISS